MNQALQSLDRLSPVSKLIVLGAVGYAGWYLYDKTFGQSAQGQALINSIPDNTAALPRPAYDYGLIAEDQFNIMNMSAAATVSASLFSWIIIGKLISGLAGLSNAELAEVARQFGTRAPQFSNLLGFVKEQPLNLFGSYQACLSDADVAKMKQVWVGTGLWN
jgi:hypothetical protein